MRQRFQLTMVLLAWFMATGAQWDVVQTFGWARMIVNYSETMPLLKAIQQTFAGELCGVCEAVDEAKQQQEPAPNVSHGKLALKLVFVTQPALEFSAPVLDVVAWSLSDTPPVSASRAAPPVRPPRV